MTFPRSSNPMLNAMMSPVRQFDQRQALAKSNPMLAALYRIEAMADRRIECDVNALSLLTDIRDLARETFEEVTGSGVNRLYR